MLESHATHSLSVTSTGSFGMGTASIRGPEARHYLRHREAQVRDYYKVCSYCGQHRSKDADTCSGCGAALFDVKIVYPEYPDPEYPE